MEFSDTVDLKGQAMPEPNKMLEAIQKDGKTLWLQEAHDLAGFEPNAPTAVPEGYKEESISVETDAGRVKFSFKKESSPGNVIMVQTEADDEFKTVSSAILGKIGDNTAELQSPIQSDAGILDNVGTYSGATGVNSIKLWELNAAN